MGDNGLKLDAGILVQEEGGGMSWMCMRDDICPQMATTPVDRFNNDARIGSS